MRRERTIGVLAWAVLAVAGCRDPEGPRVMEATGPLFARPGHSRDWFAAVRDGDEEACKRVLWHYLMEVPDEEQAVVLPRRTHVEVVNAGDPAAAHVRVLTRPPGRNARWLGRDGYLPARSLRPERALRGTVP